MATENQPKQLQDYTIPVRRSIIKRDLWLGIPFVPLMVLIFVSVIIILGFNQYFFIVVSVVLWFILKQITRNDEWLLDIIITSILQPDDLR